MSGRGSGPAGGAALERGWARERELSGAQTCCPAARPVVCTCALHGAGSTLALIDPGTGGVSKLDTPFTSYGEPTLAVHEVRALDRAGLFFL